MCCVLLSITLLSVPGEGRGATKKGRRLKREVDDDTSSESTDGDTTPEPAAADTTSESSAVDTNSQSSAVDTDSQATAVDVNSEAFKEAPRWKQCFHLTGVTQRLEALPGTGWDNLMNKDMGLVFEHTYDKCKVTEDGKFLIPDHIHAIPLQKSQVRNLL